ncbi:hypothetical protein [Allopontixanthobacter sediminis]|uniref:Uncharacterized protein n=1 Tax=Allopontixanthobacter sediminis TaxID=1689985 RepID=A0A845B638_9SPHN|nr:hypothetical protein [Allopontixanthobacter sediminis]MXP45614.1 hypothetical protein [Allopontixanthobacter sediminis]
MEIFTKGERVREGPPRAGESRYSYLNASAREEAAIARRTVEDWLADYPAGNFSHWLGDFQSADDGQHQSAFFELFLFQFFSKSGCEIIAVEPSFEGQKGNPDFHLRDKVGREFIVEAISPNFSADINKGKEKLTAEIKDAINSLPINNHLLILEKIEAPFESINKKRLADALLQWIANNPDENDLFEYRDKGALVQLKAIARRGLEASSRSHRPIAVEMGDVSISTPGMEIRRGLEKKPRSTEI